MPVILKVISSICLSLTLGAISLIIVVVMRLIISQYHIHGDDMLNFMIPGFIAFVMVFLIMMTLQRHIHQFQWIYQILSIFGTLFMISGIALYIRGSFLCEAHVPLSLSLRLQYEFIMVTGSGVGILGSLLFASAGTGFIAKVIAARRINNLGQQGTSLGS